MTVYRRGDSWAAKVWDKGTQRYRFGGRRFDVGAVEAWLASGNPRPKVDRMALLEGENREIKAELRDLRGKLERLERTAG